jgi:hypothetical protein
VAAVVVGVDVDVVAPARLRAGFERADALDDAGADLGGLATLTL